MRLVVVLWNGLVKMGGVGQTRFSIIRDGVCGFLQFIDSGMS